MTLAAALSSSLAITEEETYRARTLAFLNARSAGDVRHSGRSLTDHLLGVEAILIRWGAPAAVQAAGLFHSIYVSVVRTFGTTRGVD